ncbi:MAG TPA: CPBP family intramembrane metalloprotease [Candidatus Marinimicrobia bacterium]|nr:CPBP family intramembrane metalloprotease [Candidatus Neomarinimicrobiota bacterium]
MFNILPSIKTAIILLIIGLVLASLTAAGVMFFSPTLIGITSVQMGLLIGELFLPLPIYLWAKKNGANLCKLFRINYVPWRAVTAAIPLSLGLTIIIDELDRFAQTLASTPLEFSKIQEIVTISNPLSAVFIIGVVVIIAPLVEELVFRGFLQRILEYRIRDVTKAVLYSALIFAFIHFNPWWIVQIYIIGVFMGYVAWRTNSIWISFVIHAINNGVAILFSHLADGTMGWYEWKGYVSPIILFAGILLLFGGMYWFRRNTPTYDRRTEFLLIEDQSDNQPKTGNE